jgi:putative transposase
LEAIYAKPKGSLKSSVAKPDHGVYAYLLGNVTMERVNQVGCTASTSIRLRGGFIYLVAILDWFSR